ncbi:MULTISPECIES: NTP transferase domain-containing protein [Mesorhizobium]|uniref:4-diphosphocytidyl-2C-methyl-D-erythritol kinase n=1 Tax=Mesorhizobium denitrificans TaxID=2294114 RepID=A0A371X6P3_9HYPH|nr:MULTISPECIES: molybdopterin-binding/glycosyltransferase family 2 protein [Mesorhizobium]RFC64881.1 4-diphosphocytidyl-2C-methyl-D-erythritol kinase [Mesorhizobium denitrificans]
MKFGSILVEQAEGTILAHSVAVGDKMMRKARTLSGEDIAELIAAGVKEVIVARLDPDDINEDTAALMLVEAMRFSGIDAKPPATGRVNLHAQHAGVLVVDEAAIQALNAIDPAVTIATLAQHAPVETGRMVATVKIIPYAVPRDILDRALRAIRTTDIFAVHPYRSMTVGLVQTTLPGVKPSVLDKTVRVTETRLARSGSVLSSEQRVSHEAAAVADALRKANRANDMMLVFGASAVSDFDDVIPAAIRAAGGTVTRTGMPVDPGNLLVLGHLDGKPVIGAPGCARSPKENGFDWVLDRTLAGIELNDTDIARMGVGGLLMEIASRPQPREGTARSEKIYIIILAAGRSSRMGGPNKLMAEFDGKPLVRLIAERACASRASGVLLVTGHDAARVEATLSDLKLQPLNNPDYAIGLSSSLKVGMAALPPDATGALIVLGDMPGITTADLDRMIAAFRREHGNAIIRATHNGKRGNPVILPRALFGSVATLEGDTGARHLVEAESAAVIDIELGEGASVDVDTPEAMAKAGGVLRG